MDVHADGAAMVTFSMPDIRAAVIGDLAALTALYNHYVIHTPVTFDLLPLQVEQRRVWFDAHHMTGRHRLLVADERGEIVGYAATGPWRPRAAYDTTVESSIYVRPGAVRRGIGRQLYTALFDAIADADVHTIVAGVTLPNDASVALHERLGFRQVGVFEDAGRKFDRFWDVAWFQRLTHGR
jgi:phosphinothricin acetyltransferase